MKQVRKINLSGLGLTEIPAEVFQHTNLTKLVLSRNAITRIPKEISKLKKLEVLDLTYNELESLPAPVFKLPKMRVLAIGHNKIKKFPAQMVGSTIKDLIADHNHLKEIAPEALDGLRKLVISYNPLSGQIVTHLMPKLEYYDFRKTNLEIPDMAFVPSLKKWWQPIHPALIPPQMIINRAYVESFIGAGEERERDGCIFISHSSKDKNLVEEFHDKILLLGMGIPKERIKCTSIDGRGIQNGVKMREWIHEQITDCDLAFMMISPAYLDSQICLNEMGAIWALDKKVKILLLPGVDYKSIGWLEEVRQAGLIGDDSTLDKLAEELKSILQLNVDLTEWGRNKKKFLQYCKDYVPSYNLETDNRRRNGKTDDIYLRYCDQIFELLQYRNYSSWTEMLVGAGQIAILAETLDGFEDLREYLDSRNSHTGYELFNQLFESLSLWCEDFMDVFNLYADQQGNVCRIRQFYKENPKNRHYDDELEDYNSYTDFIRNMVFELTCLCNKLLQEARRVKVDYKPDFGIFSICGLGHKKNGIVRFFYRNGEVYRGLRDFLDTAMTREFFWPFKIDRVKRVLGAVLEER